MANVREEAIARARQGAPLPEWLQGSVWDNGPWWREVLERPEGVISAATLKTSEECEIRAVFAQVDLADEWCPEWQISWQEWPSGDVHDIYTGGDPEEARKAVADLVATSREMHNAPRIFVTYDEVDPDEGPEGMSTNGAIPRPEATIPRFRTDA